MVRKTERKPSWNYLRVRGEYRVLGPKGSRAMELPPRARRIPFDNTTDELAERTTSACAENTKEALKEDK